jgi:hypothetical protein
MKMDELIGRIAKALYIEKYGAESYSTAVANGNVELGEFNQRTRVIAEATEAWQALDANSDPKLIESILVAIRDAFLKS